MKCKYRINELDCANCANAVEKALNKDENINNAIVNYSKLTITLDTSIENNVKEYVEEIVKKTEPDVKLYEMNENIKSNDIKPDIIRLSLGIILSLIGMLIFKGTISKLLIILSYIVLLSRVFKNAINLLVKTKTIDENLLLTISCIGAYLTNNIHEGLMVIILYEIGKILESIAVNNSRKSISDLMDIKPDYANLKEDNTTIKIDPELVKINDIIIIKQGEKIPLDGIITKGEAKLNTSALTGESKLVSVSKNDEVLSGSINAKGLIEVKVTKLYNDSTVARILELVETATDKKAKTENFVAKAARIYTPIVLLLATLTFLLLPIFFNTSYNDSLYRALVFLVISCPCAIAISVPLSYFSGIGKASKEGILIKGSNYLDSLSNINKIIFDKTGTLTTGSFTDYKLEILDNNYNKDEVIDYLLKGESLSNHPIAKSIINIFNKKVINNDVENFKEISGKGISLELDNKKIKIGSPKFCNVKENDNYIYININNKNIAKLELLDGLKKESKNTIKKLKELGIEPIMYTGDSKDIAMSIGKSIGIDNIEYELLPEDKYKLLEKNLNNNDTVAFVGDGINDAPSLARSDIGISMGSIGSASAIEASDIVIMTDNLEKIVTGINISKKTNHIVKQNLIFALGVKVLVLILSFLGLASMWQAVFADTGLTLLTILNTTRILKK
ncbi:MAG: heavy metal translocating P-type ATPase [Bacilli bacterium]|nr:heavy metal translocating P-type ATPase [Bacilli bacterium]